MDTKHQSIIEKSWSRCRKAGLEHASSPVIELASASKQSEATDENSSLITTTENKVIPFYDNLLTNSNCLISLADSRGQLLNSWGEKRFFSKKQPNVFQKGVSWQETLLGTNAIGTTLETGEIVQVVRDEHFLMSNRFMTGSAAPLFDADRKIAGVLSISSDAYMPTSHTLGMVKIMSQAVENQLITSRFEKEFFLFWFNSSVENIDSQWSALIVFDDAGTIISANRRAEVVLGRGLALQNIEQIFDTNLSLMLSQPAHVPFAISTVRNVNFHGVMLPPQVPKARQLDFRVSEQPTPPSVPTSPTLDLDKLDMGDPRLSKAIAQSGRILNTDIPILIHGETGVGKEVFVKALHRSSARSSAPLIAVNCAAIPNELVESELFGYEKGAFTGAHNKGYIGLIRKADKGTLFLDELGDMPTNVQARLLRVLQERKVTPLGSTTSFPVDFKLISATNRNLKLDVEAGSFRQDLYYRVTGLNITLPTLRDRIDKEALISFLLEKYAFQLPAPTLSSDVMAIFKAHPWPGNIRQMVSVIQIAIAMADDNEITLEHLPDDFFSDLPQTSFDQSSMVTEQETGVSSPSSLLSPRTVNANAEQENHKEWRENNQDVLTIYEQNGRNVSATAKALNLSRNTVYKRLKELRIR